MLEKLRAEGKLKQGKSKNCKSIINFFPFLGQKKIMIGGDKFNYQGEINEHGFAYGEGVATHMDGRTYVGSFLNDLREGRGK